MAETAKSQPNAAKAENENKKEEPKKCRFLPSWWVVQPKPEKVKKPFKQEVIEWGATLLVAFILASLIRMFVFEPVRVDGNSMYPTLHHNEIMFVSKWDYGTAFLGVPFTNLGVHFAVGGEPERFDVVVCNYPNRYTDTGSRQNFVKRVIGLPGDTIEIKNGYLYVNGAKVEEKFLHERMRKDFGPYTVPAEHYLLMGDNRNNSNDSRNPDVGAVTRDMIVGKVEGVIWHDIPATLEDSGLKNWNRND